MNAEHEKHTEQVKWKRSNQAVELVLVTPVVAEAMLSCSRGNRPINESHLDALIAEIKSGEWRCTGQGVTFNIDGVLIDGHHRLMSIVESGKCQTLVVMMGADLDAHKYIDGVQRKRTVSEHLAIPRDVADVVRLAASIAFSCNNPLISQLEAVNKSILGSICSYLMSQVPTKTKVLSCAQVKLAACISIACGEESDFVVEQYSAMIYRKYGAMTPSAQSFVRQVDTGKCTAFDRNTLYRAMVVFDSGKRNNSKIQVHSESTAKCVAYVRSVLAGLLTSSVIRQPAS